MTWPEKILWSRLRSKQIGYSFQRQAIVLGYIVDFWCNEAKVVIELDGSIHERPDVQEKDKEKDAAFARHNYACLRFSNHDVYKGMSAVLIRIWDECFTRAPKKLRLLTRANSMSRHEDSVEMRALRRYQEEKRNEINSLEFSQRYWKRRAEIRGKRQR